MLTRLYVLQFVRGKLPHLLKFLICIIFILFLLHPDRFAKRYNHIPDSAIQQQFVLSRQPNAETCPIIPDNSTEVLHAFYNNTYDETDLAKDLGINLGGWWTPSACEPVHEIALVIPYRKRKVQLKIFLRYIHEFLQNQLLSYRIIVIEQTAGKPFNRGQLMNIGFKEALKLHHFPCFIFHDVDLLPQVRKNIYGCTKQPRHMSSSINVWRYNLLYHGAFGGATAILTHQFQQANGFSNVYFGWGAEDDDLLMRIRRIGLDIIRFSPEISRYFMLPHKAEPKNPQRFDILKEGEQRSQEDGLNSLEYQVLAYRTLPLHTHVAVQL